MLMSLAGAGARDPRVARRRSQSSGEAAPARDRRHAGAGDPEPDQLHARERIRSRPHRLPAPRCRGLRRHGDGDVHGAAADARSRFVEGNAPSYLRTHPVTYERIAEAQARAQGQPYRQVRRFARLPHGARAAAQLRGRAARRGRVLRRRARRAQVQQRDRRALRARRIAAARQELQAREGRARDAREDGAAASDDRRDGRSRAARQPATSTAAIARFEAALARYPNKMQLVYDYPGGAAAGRPQRRGRGVRRDAARALSRRRPAAPDRRARLRRAGQAAARSTSTRASTTRGRATSRARSTSSSSRRRRATATSTRRRSSTRGCARCSAKWPTRKTGFGRPG